MAAPLPAILFRDRHFVVIDKPAGLAVHPGPRGGASVEDAFPALSRRKDGPWLAHRLDADTAGCLVIALRHAALLAAQAAFAGGLAHKTYWAVVRGRPQADAGVMRSKLIRRSTQAGWHVATDPHGQDAITDWQLRGAGNGLAWLELHPRTGRTHQIRVHCAALGCPVLGDPVYGGEPARPGQSPHHSPHQRLHLLARAIRLDLDPVLAAQAPVPPHMRDALTLAGWTEAD